VQLELLQDVADVVLHRVLGDEQLLGDVAVRHPPGDQPQHLHLAVGQPRDGQLLSLLGPLDHRPELGQQLAGHRRRDERLTPRNGPDAGGDLLARHVLEQVAVRAGPHGLVEVGLLVGDGQDHDLGRRRDVLDRRTRLDARAPGHPDVHQDDVRQELLGPPDRLGTVTGLTDDLDAGFLVQHHLQAASVQRVVVSDQHADRVAGGAAPGIPRCALYHGCLLSWPARRRLAGALWLIVPASPLARHRGRTAPS
jgi:hypothetical protein